MKKENLKYVWWAIFVTFVCSAIYFNQGDSDSSSMTIDEVEPIKEMVEEKVEEVIDTVKEKTEEVIEEKVEQIIEKVIPIELPSTPSIELEPIKVPVELPKDSGDEMLDDTEEDMVD